MKQPWTTGAHGFAVLPPPPVKLPKLAQHRHHYTDHTHAARQVARIAENTRRQKQSAARSVDEVRHANRAALVQGWETDHELCVMAERRAALMVDRLADIEDVMMPAALHAWLDGQVTALDARPLAPLHCKSEIADQLAGLLARVKCELWWRRQLRRRCVQLHEGRSIVAGQVGQGRAWYCTDATVRRRGLQQARNAAILAATELENDQGEVYTLAALVAKSPAAKPIRRGELMTRIRGCEEWGNAAGMVGIFTTHTLPSRFHSNAGKNGKYTGSTPKEGQQHHCETWAKARAHLARIGVRFFGFRVAEPHRDSCVHWHMLLWCDPDDAFVLVDTLESYWLADSGDEPGADMVRFQSKEMTDGDACGYAAKYVAKNIDDHGSIGVEGHIDEGETLRRFDGDGAGQADLFDDSPARRVEAWATAWGIRQFQSIGQPPVTVWRELRRVDAQTAQGGSVRLQAACVAVQRDGARRADWAAYMAAQGGAMQGRGYVLRLAVREEQREGRYEVADVTVPLGVYDVARPKEWLLSNRRKWKPRGAWAKGEQGTKPRLMDEIRGLPAQPASPPWTRFNNCTRAGFGAVKERLFEALKPLEKWAGGPSSTKETYEPHPPPDRRPGEDPSRRLASRIRAALAGVDRTAVG